MPARPRRPWCSRPGHILATHASTPAGGSVNLSFPIPGACFDPECSFRIVVDSGHQVVESNEGNNTASGTCLLNPPGGRRKLRVSPPRLRRRLARSCVCGSPARCPALGDVPGHVSTGRRDVVLMCLADERHSDRGAVLLARLDKVVGDHRELVDEGLRGD